MIIVIDACRPEYLELGRLPIIRALAREGVSYRRAWVGHLVNNTPPGHLTIASGCLPQTTGVVAFGWRDPNTGARVRPTAWEPVVSAEYGQLIAHSGVPTLASLLKQAQPSAVTAATGSIKFYAVASLGAHTADYIVFTPPTPKKPQRTLAENAAKPQLPALTLDNLGVQGQLPPPQVLEAVRALSEATHADPDSLAMEITLALVRAAQPTLLMVNLPETDGAGHRCGGITAPHTMRAVIQNADAQIGRLVALYRQLGLYDETVWLVTSDHGMIPNLHSIPQAVVRVAMRQAGLSPEKADAAPHIWLSDPSRARQVAEAIAAQRVPEVHAVFYKVKEDGGYGFRLARPAGRNASLEGVAAYQFLADTYACPNGPDVSVFTAENTVWGKKPGAAGTRGQHNSATWGTQHIPLILAGPAIRQRVTSDYPARLCDIAPTVLAALGIRPQAMDGTVLADALSNPLARDREAQSEREGHLVPLVEALEAQSQADLRRVGMD